MLRDLLSAYNLILGSGSPRRKELLSSLDVPFVVRVCPLDEIVPDGLPPREHAQFLARQKSTFLSVDPLLRKQLNQRFALQEFQLDRFVHNGLDE